MKQTVIYHRADFDGLFCREIARKFLPEAELIGWDYGDPQIPMPAEGFVYILDLSPACLCDNPQAGGLVWSRIIWIDHHKSSIEKYPMPINGYRIDGVAACRLAWQWFTIVDGNTNFGNVGNSIRAAGVLPMVQDFKERTVLEPWAVRLAGEYDIWDKRDPNAELFQHGLRSRELAEQDWRDLFYIPENDIGNDAWKNRRTIVDDLLDDGKAIQYAKTQENKSIIEACGFTIQLEGFTLLACNAARYNSQLFTAGLKPEHDGCLGFNWDGKQWRVSLYTDKPGVDLSPVAIKYGGGGHRGACGFRASELPFSIK